MNDKLNTLIDETVDSAKKVGIAHESEMNPFRFRDRELKLNEKIKKLKDEINMTLKTNEERKEEEAKMQIGKLETEMKHVVIIREDLDMSRGKFGVQIHHASVKSLMKADRGDVSLWNKQCIKTILLGVPDAYSLVELSYELEESGLPYFLTIDLGVTEFGKPTITAIGIGPAPSGAIDRYTGKLGLYKPNEKFLEENYGEEVLGKQDVMDYVKEKRKNELQGEQCSESCCTHVDKSLE